MDNYIGKYQGVDIWAISFEDFVALDPIAQVTRDKIYLILDDRRVIKTGMVFGYVTRDNKRLNPSPKSIHWTVAYAGQLTALKKKAEEAKRVQEEETVKTVVTERPTVENLAAEGAKKLNTVKHEAANKLEDMVNKSEDKVQEVLEVAAEIAAEPALESKKAMENLVAEGKQKAVEVTARPTASSTRRKRKSTTADVLKALE